MSSLHREGTWRFDLSREVVAIAKDLGVRPVTDRHMMWIAEKALHSQLPEGWTYAPLSEDGAPRYLHR